MKPEPHPFYGEYDPDKIMSLEIKALSPVQKAQHRIAKSRQWFINLAAALLFR